MRGPSFKGFLAGGAKGVFVFSRSDAPSRVAVCEAAIDALSLAAIDSAYDDTAYLSTRGGWGDAGNARDDMGSGRLVLGRLRRQDRDDGAGCHQHDQPAPALVTSR
jgi:hypothetical protein